MTSMDFSAPRRGDPSAIFHSLCKAVAGILIWTAVVVILRLLVLQVEPPETSNTDPFSFLGVLSVDALLLLISVLYSIIGWRKKTIQLKETAVSVSSGVISSSYVTLPFSDLKRLEYTEKGLCKLFGTGKVRFSNQPRDDSQTEPGVVRQDFTFLFKKADATALFHQIEQGMADNKHQ